jgi:hypothetical protein
MASQYLTAKKGSPEFEKLINGNFSQTHRALPVQNIRVGSLDEEVTFELIDVKDIKAGFSYFGFIGPKKLLFVLFPVFYFALRDWVKPVLVSPELECLILGLILSLLAVQIRVDIQDFISGYDRIRGDKGQKVLSKGWKTVNQLQKDFKIISSIAILLSLVPIIFEPKRIFALVLTLVLFSVGYKLGVSRRNRLIRDLSLAAIAGPSLAFWILPNLNSFFFGVVWGFFVFFALQLEHFQNYFAQTLAGETNLLTLRSFDQAPKILWALWAICLIVYSIVRALTSHIAWWGGSMLILIILSFLWRRSLFNLKSPAGSEIDKIVVAGNQLYYTFIALWTVELLFQALVAPLAFAWFK